MRALAILSLGVAACACQRQTIVDDYQPEPEKPAVAMTRDFAIPVLMYHRVTDLSEREKRSPLLRDLSVAPKDFEAQVKYLKEQGYTFLKVSEIEEALRLGLELPVKAVAITLDDGYRDNFTEAFPILEKYGAVATVFMVSDNFGRPQRLNPSEAKQMGASTVQFQSHSKTHADLTAISLAQLQEELVTSKQVIEQNLGAVVTSIAYPAGAFNDRVEIACVEAGYLAAWKKGGGAVQPGHVVKAFQLPRVRIHGRTDMKKFKERVRSGVEIIAMRQSSRSRVM